MKPCPYRIRFLFLPPVISVASGNIIILEPFSTVCGFSGESTHPVLGSSTNFVVSFLSRTYLVLVKTTTSFRVHAFVNLSISRLDIRLLCFGITY